MSTAIELTETETLTDQTAPLPASKPAAATSGKLPASHLRRRAPLLIGGAAILALAAGACYWRAVAPFESTDDAFVEADVTPIAPQVAGRVLAVAVSDNQSVQPGALLFQIDPRDYQAKLDQTRAELSAARGRAHQAGAQLTVDRAKVEQERANVTAAQAEAKRAAADFQRYQTVGTEAVSASQIDLAGTQARSSAAAVTAAQNRELATEAQTGLDEADIETTRAEVLSGEAAVQQAALDLSYTRVVAPVAGFVTHRGVQPGDYAQAGQAQLALVPKQLWVIANFKETQLTHMRAGQPVEISVDAYPQLKLRGHVDSIQSGAGARFSLFPAENATGNYVKVVQRVPVKIVLENLPEEPVLGPGMSVVPEVRVAP